MARSSRHIEMSSYRMVHMLNSKLVRRSCTPIVMLFFFISGCSRDRQIPIASAGVEVGAGPTGSTRVKVDADGTVEMPAFSLPYSSFASLEAKQAFLDRVVHPFIPVGGSLSGHVPSSHSEAIEELRKQNDAMLFTPWLKRARAMFPVEIVTARISGVHVDVVTPRDGVPLANQHRVLINLHNGGFLIGGGDGGLDESVPVAAIGKMKVVSVDYRMWPEYRHPAALEDLTTVYRALLKDYRPANIGIYGCSAGGLTAAESTAWFERENLPRPGAIGIFGANGGAPFAGDSGYLAAPLAYGDMPPASSADVVMPNPHGYFTGTDLRDPLVAPIYWPAVMRKFPPTLLITGTRALEMSSVVYFHTQLVKAGVDADLHLWEAMPYCFLLDPGLPESREAYDVIGKFFDRHLGKR